MANKCIYCGRIFTGAGPNGSTQICSEACYREKYGKTSDGFGGGNVDKLAIGAAGAAVGLAGAALGAVGGAIAGGVSKIAEEAAAEKAKNESMLNDEKVEISNLVKLKFSDSKEVLISQMEQLLMLYKTKKTSIVDQEGSNEVRDTRVETKKAIFEKLEFGLDKLKRIAPDEAGFIEKKVMAIKKKKKNLLIFKLSLLGGLLLLTVLFAIAGSGLAILWGFLFICVGLPLAIILNV
jgi:hypothetical protein